jgi:predicted nucleotidyltransferase
MDSEIQKIVNQFYLDAKKILKDNIVEGYLFGSYVRDEQVDLSDIDVLLIVKKLDHQIRSQISALSSDYSLENEITISSVLKDLQVWEKNRKFNTLFYQDVNKSGIPL